MQSYTPSASRRIYVKVTSSFDATGYMQPLSITLSDGRTFSIDSVQDYRPAVSLEGNPEDCYTVLIKGQEKHLFFERVSPRFRGRLGRWYVESRSTLS